MFPFPDFLNFAVSTLKVACVTCSAVGFAAIKLLGVYSVYINVLFSVFIFAKGALYRVLLYKSSGFPFFPRPTRCHGSPAAVGEIHSGP